MSTCFMQVVPGASCALVPSEGNILRYAPYDAFCPAKRPGQLPALPLHGRTITPATSSAFIDAVVCFTLWLQYREWQPDNLTSLNFWLCVCVKCLFSRQLPEHLEVWVLCGIQHFYGLKSTPFALPWNAVKA